MEFHKTNQPLPQIALALVLLASVSLWGIGCQHRTVSDYLAAGDQAIHSSRLADAESDYGEAIKLAPRDTRGYMALGNLYMFEQKGAQARQQYLKVLQLDPGNIEAHLALAGLYASESNFGSAENQYRATVALAPAKAAYRLRLGIVLQKEGKASDAEAEFRTAAGLDPRNAHAHFALANLLSSEPGHQAEAQKEYAEAKSLDASLTAPAAAPSPMAAAGSAASAAKPKIKTVNRRFLLTKNSDVYQDADKSSLVVGHVHRRGYVHVIGITGNWLQIKLRNGTVGFIPVAAAE